MITSQRQLKASKEKLDMLTSALSGKLNKELPSVLQKAAASQTQELIAEIQSEINEYENLKKEEIVEIAIESLEDLMKSPIRFRIANGMSIEDFARKVDIHSRQIARYEEEEYHNATTDTLMKILGSLDLKISGSVRVDNHNPKPRKLA